MTRYVETQKSQKFEDYFATKEVTDAVPAIIEKIDSYYTEMNRTGRVNLYRNSYFKFYQGFVMKGALYHSGSSGELTNTYVNHYANLITHATNIVCQQKLSWEPQATMNDSQAMDQIKLAKGILYFYANRSDMDIDGVLRNSTEMSQVFAESYVSVLWNKNKGKPLATIMTEEEGVQVAGGEIKEGDNEYEVYSPFDVIVDTTLSDNSQKSWIVIRRWENKYEVAAQYPNWEQEIIHLSPGANLGDTQLTWSITDESDNLPVYYFFHKKSAAIPKGRFIKFIDDTVILSDGDLSYREIPVFRMATRELWGSPYAYSRAFDLLPLQDTVDCLTSAIVTNQLTFATQNILLPKGSSISWENLYGGLNVIEWDASMGEPGKPTALQLTATPPEVFSFIQSTVMDMGTLYGVNEVTKGNPDLALKGQVSGAALAMMSSNSIQFNSDLQKAYIRLAEQVGTATIHNIQDFAFPNGLNLKRDGMSLSATKKYFKRQYGKNDIDKIDKIVVRYGNPLSQTTSGRMQIAETFLQNGLIKTPQEYTEVVENGSLEPLLEAQDAQLHLIKEENESIAKGEVPTALWSDDHVLHIQEHLADLANLDARNNPTRINATKAHVDQHIQNLKTLDPVIAGLMKQPVLGAPPAGPTNVGPGNGPKPPVPGIPAANQAGLPQSVPTPQAQGQV